MPVLYLYSSKRVAEIGFTILLFVALLPCLSVYLSVCLLSSAVLSLRVDIVLSHLSVLFLLCVLWALLPDSNK